MCPGIDWLGLVVGAGLVFVAGGLAGVRIGWKLWRQTYVTGAIEPMRRRYL